MTKPFDTFRKWIGELDRKTTDPSSETPIKLIIMGMSMLAMSVLSSILATWIAQEIFNYSFSAAFVIGMVLALTFLALLQVNGLPFRLSALKLVAVLVTFVVLEGVGIGYLWMSNRPSINYMVFDATNATIPQYASLIQNIRLAAQVQSPRTLDGLRIYGGGMSGATDCSDTVELVAPIQAKQFEKSLDKAFASFDPRGNASLTIAVWRAITEDLQRYRGPKKVIVITSGIDPECEAKSPEIFKELAKEIRTHKSSDVSIAIIGVGDLAPEVNAQLQEYALALDGTYLNASEPAELNSLLLASPSYIR